MSICIGGGSAWFETGAGKRLSKQRFGPGIIQAMTQQRLGTIASGLAATLAARIDLTDAEAPGLQADLLLQARVMDLYAQQLQALPDEEAIPWLLRRMAMIEARLLAVQSQALSLAPETTLAAADSPPASNIMLPCDAVLVQGGFYPAELSRDGVAFRWIGPAPLATVFLPRMRAPLTIRLHVHSAFVPAVLDEVRLALDGGEWVSATRLDGAAGSVLTAILAPGPVNHAGLLRLDIDTARTASPQATGGTDTRHLSLALSCIEAESR
jgi:hypothetical protein